MNQNKNIPSAASDTPETDAEKLLPQDLGSIVSVAFAEKLERQRNYWRTHHDRKVCQYQHILTVLATSAIEAIYPDNMP